MNIEDCPHRYFSKGFKQPKDNGMPEFMWGSYLPADAPGYMCDIDGDGCVGEDCELLKEEENES